jgi:hypothetical protein
MRGSLTCLLIVSVLSLWPVTTYSQQKVGPPEPPPGRVVRAVEPGARLGELSARETAARPRKAARQIGVSRPVDSGQINWSAVQLPGARRIWRAVIESPGALQVRVHISGFSAGSGRLWVYGGGDEFLGPYSEKGPLDSGEFWSGTVKGPRAVLEYEGAAKPLFRLDALSHAWVNVTGPSGAGPASCELDAACYSPYLQYIPGTFLYLFVADSGGLYQCSAAMVHTKAHTGEPYWLTANHCISTESEAQSVEAHFADYAPACNYPVPPQGYGVARYPHFLVGAPESGGDYSLLRFPEDTGTAYFDLATTEPAVGESLTGIHYPRGSFAHIAFGVRDPDQDVNVQGTTAPAAEYYQVEMRQGILEPGSSGSPLLNAKGEIVGVASAAPSAPTPEAMCSIRPFVAVYGRVSQGMSLLAPYLVGDAAPQFTVTRRVSIFN